MGKPAGFNNWKGAVDRAHSKAGAAQTTATSAQATATQASSDAGTALAAANAASSAAAAAGTLASNAQASANGKNTVFYSATTPSANAANDTWFQTAVQHVPPPSGPLTTVIIGQYKSTAAGTGSWVSQPLTSATFAYIDAGKITTGTLSGVNVIGTFIETQANVGTGSSPSVVPGVLLDSSGDLFCYSNTGPKLIFQASTGQLTLNGGTLNASTIYNSTLDTSIGGSGQRVVIVGNQVEWYGGGASETLPGHAKLVLGSASGVAFEELELQAPVVNGNTGGTIELISSMTAGGGGIALNGDVIAINPVSGGYVAISQMATSTGTAVGINGFNQLVKISSSRRYKTAIKALPIVPDALKIRPKRWRYKTEDHEQWGPIAEDVEKVAPELVTHDEKGRPESVDAGRVAMVQVQALLDRIDAQDKRIRQLERQVKP